MIEPSKPISFRPGSLSGPLIAWCDEHDETPSNAIRIALSAMLGEELPDMPVGNPRLAEQAKKGAQARWRKAKKRR